MNVVLILLLLVAPTLLTSSKDNDTKTYYYFCLSGSMTPGNTGGKETILYTEIVKVNTGENFFSKKAFEWMQKVNGICANKNGCSSDVNYYPTLEAAEIQHKRIYQRYWNPAKYVMKQVNP